MLLSDNPAIAAGLAALTQADPDFHAVMARLGPLQFTRKPAGYAGMLRIILGQQVSVLAADAMWRRLSDRFDIAPALFAGLDNEALRECGLSRQKIRYVKELATDIVDGRLNLMSLDLDDEAAIAAITRSVGLGRWTAENYLLFCEARADLFPAKDLAILIGLEWLKKLERRPSPAEAWEYAQRWRPHRSAATLLIWHHYIGVVADRRARPRGEASKQASNAPGPG